MANNIITPSMVVRYALRPARCLEIVSGGPTPVESHVATVDLPFNTAQHVMAIEDFVENNAALIDSVFDELLYARAIYDLPVIPSEPSAVHRYNGVSMRGTVVYNHINDDAKLRLEVAYS